MNESMIYLDNSATTALSDGVIDAMTAAARCYGNPSSVHAAGLESAALLRSCRADVASAFGLRRSDGHHIIFTASGSEANNLALRGAALAKKRRISNRIITTDSEHPSVANTAASLTGEGFEVVKIPTRGGELDMDVFERELERGAMIVSLMLVNNETGARYDVERAFRMAHKKNPETITHCDAVQGFMRVRFTPASLDADLVSVSAHKIHGPKGVGALCVAPGIIRAKCLAPVIYGGGQEEGFRSGTENLIGIAGFARACTETCENSARDAAHMDELYRHALNVLPDAGVRLNLPANAAGHILSLTLPGIRSETMLHFLSGKGICVSAGSACSSHAHGPSGTLLAFGLSPTDADRTLRVSFGSQNTIGDIDRLADALREGIGRLVRAGR